MLEVDAALEVVLRHVKRPEAIPGSPGRAYASMGNYLFKPEVLAGLLDHAVRRGGIDFGAHIMPALPASGLHALSYDFACNELPGVKPYEDRAYWTDVGTLGALARARADVAGDRPRFDLSNRQWPIRRDLLAPPPRAKSPAVKNDPFAAATLLGQTPPPPPDATTNC